MVGGEKESSMHKITGSLVVNAPREQVWNVLADFGNVYKVSPGVKHSHSTSEAPNGEGATRHCDLSLMGATVEERITRYEAPSLMEIDIYEWKKLPFMKKLGADFTLDEQGDKTLLTGVFWYEMTRNPVGHVMNALMMKRMNKKTWVQFMAGIKHYAETGDAVEDSTTLDLAAVTT